MPDQSDYRSDSIEKNIKSKDEILIYIFKLHNEVLISVSYLLNGFFVKVLVELTLTVGFL